MYPTSDGLTEEFAKADRTVGELYHLVLALYPADPINSAGNMTIRLTQNQPKRRDRREGGSR
jgi:hypothetical protein